MDLLRAFTRGQLLMTKSDVAWMWTTSILSVLVLVGYVAIAFAWYFQSKLARRESAKALRHLRNIALICAGCGYALWMFELPWVVWRLYNLILLMLVWYTWGFLLRTRGLSLIDELEQAASRYREIAELLPHMVWTATENGRVDYANRRWTEFSGCATWLDAVHPEERADVAAWWATSLGDRLPVGREIRLQGRAEYRTFIVRATPIFHGAAVKWLGACADIEDQKRLAADKEVQAKQKSFFLNALSHDLRAPLNSVVLNAHVLKMTPGEPADVETVNVILENALAAGELLTKLLEYAKAGHDENAAEVVSVTSMLHQIRRRFAPLAQQKALELRVVEDQDLRCSTDRNKLERILSNLVDNAIKHTRTGGIELSSAPAEDEYVAMRIADTGTGIPAEHAPHLFDEFYQVNNHERDRSKGFGLGLAICRSLARQLGGDVRLVKTDRAGSCFELLLPGCGARGRGRLDGPAGNHAHPPAPGFCAV